MSYKKFGDIEQFTRWSGYQVDISWQHLIDSVQRYIDEDGADINPDFQRGHVWTEPQQIAYVEFCLRGGKSGRTLHWNCPGWMHDFRGPFVLVDGKQRLTAILRFLQNWIPAFGKVRSEYEGKLLHVTTNFHINDLPTRAATLQWYLELNDGGVVHTKEELDKVRKLLKKERK